jgi:lysozyme family protein
MDNFPNCLAFTLKYEGGFVNDPRDPGGATSLGVTIATLSHELGRAATIADVRGLTEKSVEPIYRKKYWQTIHADCLPKGVDLMAFDIAVNMGVGRALPWIRQTSHLSPLARIDALNSLRCGFWKGLRTWRVFGKGWMARETACLGVARMMAKP